ncbi:MAG: hypothetical protein QXF15_01945, partial [Candidatus Aenigmatarchaeota archaeon]
FDFLFKKKKIDPESINFIKYFIYDDYLIFDLSFLNERILKCYTDLIKKYTKLSISKEKIKNLILEHSRAIFLEKGKISFIKFNFSYLSFLQYFIIPLPNDIKSLFEFIQNYKLIPINVNFTGVNFIDFFRRRSFEEGPEEGPNKFLFVPLSKMNKICTGGLDIANNVNKIFDCYSELIINSINLKDKKQKNNIRNLISLVCGISTDFYSSSGELLAKCYYDGHEKGLVLYTKLNKEKINEILRKYNFSLTTNKIYFR